MPKLVFQVLGLTHESDGNRRKVTKLIKALRGRLRELAIRTTCWRNESLQASREDLVAVVVKVIRGENTGRDLAEETTGEMPWMAGLEEAEVPEVVC